MGQALVRCILEHPEIGLELCGAIDLWDCPHRGRDAGITAGAVEAGIEITTDLATVASDADVVIDFTGHHGTVGNAPRCAEWKNAMVIGTTGLSDEEQKVIEEAAKSIPIMLAPNMSLGINLLLSLVHQAALTLKNRGYDVEIVERHHRRKKDAPSGTALALGEAAAVGMSWKLGDVTVHGRSGVPGERPDQQIGFHAVRGGDFVGDHTVIFAGDGESIELSHRATSRDTFAMGALQAATWITDKEPGLYSMRDVLGL